MCEKPRFHRGSTIQRRDFETGRNAKKRRNEINVEDYKSIIYIEKFTSFSDFFGGIKKKIIFASSFEEETFRLFKIKKHF